jgi:WD40 repeat protein
VRLWDLSGKARGGAAEKLAQGGADALAFAPDGQSLFTLSARWFSESPTSSQVTIDQWGDLWSLQTGGRTHRLTVRDHSARTVAFSPDGKMFALGSTGPTVSLWEVASWKQRGTLRVCNDIVKAVAFSPDGRILATAGGDRDPAIRVWDLASGKELRHFQGHRGRVRGLAFSPDGQSLASLGEDTTVLVWDVAGAVR